MSAFPNFRTPSYIRYHPSFYHKPAYPHPPPIQPYSNKTYDANYNNSTNKGTDHYRNPTGYITQDYNKSNNRNNNKQSGYKQNHSESYNGGNTSHSNNTNTKKEERKKEEEKSGDKIIEIFGLKLHTDDILIIGLLFFLYQDGIKDQELFISLVLLLIT